MDSEPTVESGVMVPKESGLRDSIRVILCELLQEMNGSPENRKSTPEKCIGKWVLPWVV